MLINIFEEVSWENFIQIEKYKNLPLNEQEAYYKQYIQDLEIARQNWLAYQNKGTLVRTTTSSTEAPGDPVSCAQGMDVVFLIDYTGSMGTVIDDVKTNILSIVNTIITQSGGDYRLGLVLFDEMAIPTQAYYETKIAYTSLPASQRYTNENPLAISAASPNGVKQFITAMEVMSTQNQTSFITQLNLLNTQALPLGYGVRTWEPGGMGYEQILNEIAGAFRSNVAKLVILITDAPPGGDDDFYDSTDETYLQGLAAQGLQDNVQVLVLTKQNETAGYRILSDGTNGSYTTSATLSPSEIITQIENICVDNA